MNSAQVRSAVNVSVWVIPLGPDIRLKKGHASFRFGLEPGEYFITQDKNLATVKLRDKRQRNDLDFFLGSGRACLATVDQVSRNGTTALVRVLFFNGGPVEMGAVDIGIDDYVSETANKVFGSRHGRIGELLSLLEEQCVLRLGPADEDCYFLLTSGAAAAQEFEADTGPQMRGEASSEQKNDSQLQEEAFLM